MNRMEQVMSLSLELPEMIQRRRECGDLKGAARAADALLKNPDLPRMMRARLMVEKERMRRLPTQYPLSREEAFRKLKEHVADLTEAEFDAFEDQGFFDWIMAEGEKRYFVRNTQLALKRPELAKRSDRPLKKESEWLDPMIREARETGVCARRMDVEAVMKLEPEAFVPGEYRAWIPVPAECAQQKDIAILSQDPHVVAPPDAPARCAYWERKMKKWEDFRIRYAWTGEIRYADPLHEAAPAEPLYPRARPVCAEDLQEELPHIRFTPFLRSLAAEVAGSAETAAEKAWKFYCFITDRVRYSYVRDYFQIDNPGEFCAKELKGDCGLQALLFIALCRISGIPARWQSGLCIDEDGVGCHDWAQFYLPGWGWLFADPSFGGGARRCGAEERHAFYFGNIDPTRLAANRIFCAELTPAGEALRIDPYDNQSGELEREGAELPFTGRELDTDFTLISLEKA